MPIKLHELAAKTRALEIPYAGDKVVFAYYPARFTPQVAFKASDMANAPIPVVALAELLAEVIAEWDILGENGKPLPVTQEWINQMPSDLLEAIIVAVGEDMRPKGLNGSDSNAT
jgi:hypothetical protein